jgi:hypothetical protein
MGLTLGLLLYIRESRSEGSSTCTHRQYNSSHFNTYIAIFGSLIIIVFFPFLSLDPDAYTPINPFSINNSTLSLVLAMSAGVFGAFSATTFINGRIVIRDIVNSPIAGGIVAGSASFFITNPVYAVIAGFTGGLVQTLIQNSF